ncbi:glutathione S-transferase T2-like [Eutrema salsugineum]|uniref:glutathione S-transferase T2-like n=1 Tax=Eutrema salsugineum TaxID=72664 RepID=UPI000CED160A|nr:glutathione S-transferase T2-like [Eutrema salsugineum]
MASPHSFLNLLNSQEENGFSFSPNVDLGSSQLPPFSSQLTEEPTVTVDAKTSKRKWHPTKDIVLISAWLNTSKDPVIGNDQKPAHFGVVSVSVKQQSSGQNDNDLMKAAHQIFVSDHGFKFGLEHCWRELRHDQKWSSVSAVKESEVKKRKNKSPAATSPHEVDAEESPESRPPGVKAAKKALESNGKGKKGAQSDEDDGQELTEMNKFWEIKKQDLAIKDRLSKQKLLDSLVLRMNLLSEKERALKDKLVSELLG